MAADCHLSLIFEAQYWFFGFLKVELNIFGFLSVFPRKFAIFALFWALRSRHDILETANFALFSLRVTWTITAWNDTRMKKEKRSFFGVYRHHYQVATYTQSGVDVPFIVYHWEVQAQAQAIKREPSAPPHFCAHTLPRKTSTKTKWTKWTLAVWT